MRLNVARADRDGARGLVNASRLVSQVLSRVRDIAPGRRLRYTMRPRDTSYREPSMNSNKILLSRRCSPRLHRRPGRRHRHHQTSGKASFINVGGEGVNQIKGKRQRTDSTVGRQDAVSLIIDIDSHAIRRPR